MADVNPSIVTWKNAGGSGVVYTLVTEGAARLWGQEFAGAGCGTLPAPAVLDPTREMAVGAEGPCLDLDMSPSLGNISGRKHSPAYEQFPSCLWQALLPGACCLRMCLWESQLLTKKTPSRLNFALIKNQTLTGVSFCPEMD